MSSRGAKIKNGHVTTDEYKTKRLVYDAKVLVGKDGNHGLPDYSHSPNRIYIKENSDGSFREMRIYDEEGIMYLEIAYHAEEALTGNRHDKVLHYHLINKELKRSDARKMSSEIYCKYKKYLEVYGL